MKIIGLDYGSVTVGVAMSDELLMGAWPKETIKREKEGHLRRTLSRIDELIRENDVTKIVLGLPLHTDGTESERANKTLEFKDKLEKRTGLEVILVNECYTTKVSEEELKEMGVKLRDKKLYVDQLAAVHILEEYLNSIRR